MKNGKWKTQAWRNFYQKQQLFVDFVCLFLQQAINKTGAFIDDIRSDSAENEDINMLVAFQAMESFLIDYGKIHFKVNESKVVSQRSFCE